MSDPVAPVEEVGVGVVLPLRSAVLRDGGPADLPGDDDPATVHLAARTADGEVAGVVRRSPAPCPWRGAGAPWQLRAMATDEAVRGTGSGRALVTAGLAPVAARAGDLVWCTARVPAAGSYERMGSTAVTGPSDAAADRPPRRDGHPPALSPAARRGLQPMTRYVQTADGVRIAYDREGSGQPLVLIGGAGQFRAVDPDTAALSSALAGRGFDVVVHDRPGRGDSGGESPFGLAGEVAAVRALLDLLGGRAWLYGSSSGGAIALAAAAELPGVERLFLWEVPLGEEEGSDGAEYLAAVRALVAAGDREGTWRLYTDGMPPEWFEAMRTGPRWPLFEHMAPTLEADAEALAWTQSAPWARLWATVTVPTVVLLGTSTFPFMAAAADSLVAALPHAERVEVPGHDHGWEPAAMAAALAASLTVSGGPSATGSS